MKCWNPECFNRLDSKAVSCPVCGWDKPNTKAGAPNPLWWRCCDVDRDGNQCANPGSLSEGTRGGDRWFCAVHFPPFKTRGYKRTAPPPGFFGAKNPARSAAILAEEVIERQAIQSEGE